PPPMGVPSDRRTARHAPRPGVARRARVGLGCHRDAAVVSGRSGRQGGPTSRRTTGGGGRDAARRELSLSRVSRHQGAPVAADGWWLRVALSFRGWEGRTGVFSLPRISTNVVVA